MANSLIVGAGYTGRFLFKRLKQKNNAIFTLSRSMQFLNNPSHITANLDNQNTLASLSEPIQEIKAIYYLAPPSPDNIEETRVRYFIRLLLDYVPTSTHIKIVYVSTTGVYGDQNSAWVDEKTQVKPDTLKSKRRLSAEQQFLELNKKANIDVVILRVPGIYGPERIPLNKIKQGCKIIKQEQSGYTNLIHVNDLVTILINAMQKGQPGEIYNISDGHPIKSSEYYSLVAKIANLPAPQEVSREVAKQTFARARLDFLMQSRRLSVEKMQTQLQPQLKYSNLKEGIKQALQIEHGTIGNSSIKQSNSAT